MRSLDVLQLADSAAFGRSHAGFLFWCALIIICDGCDLAVAGIALPSIMKEMGVTPRSAGFMASSALFGMMFGAIFLGTIADQIGRCCAIAIWVALLSLFTATAGMSTDPVMFCAMRFVAGPGSWRKQTMRRRAQSGYNPRRPVPRWPGRLYLKGFVADGPPQRNSHPVRHGAGPRQTGRSRGARRAHV